MKRSIDDLSEKLQTTKKPVFLSKAEREQLALKREIEEKKRRQEQESQSSKPNSSSSKQSSDDATRHRSSRDHDRDRDRRDRDRRLRDSRYRAWEREEDSKIGGETGMKKPKKRVPTPDEKFLISIDWEDTADRREHKKQKKDRGDEGISISYKGSKVPRPIRSWEESGLSTELLKAVDSAGYKTPSPIQMAAIPLALQQRDVLVIAESGSGKTAAFFLLPMLNYITRLPPLSQENKAQGQGPYAVVLAPTIELAQQIEEEAVKVAHYLGIQVVSIVGGQEQGSKIRQGCEVVIATPDSLIDCLQSRCAVLDHCNFVVLYSADHMLYMGLEPQVMGVLEAMPLSNFKPENKDEELDEKKIYRTTYMFSATMPDSLEKLARKYLRNPVVLTIGTA